MVSSAPGPSVDVPGTGDGRDHTVAATTRTTARAAPRRTRRRRAGSRPSSTATTAAATTPRTTTGARPRSPSGAEAPARATPSTQPSSTRVGRCSAVANGPPTSPATVPAVRPQIITGPAAGAASRFAGTDARGTPPKAGTSSGATASWAATATPPASAIADGPGRWAAIGRASSTIPADAATESWKAREPASRGSISTRPVTARASTRIADTGHPNVAAPVATRAMAVARSTEGSKRVSRAKNRRTPTAKTNRERRPSRRRTGPARARTKATLAPDTASRWLRPAARKSNRVSADVSRSSPTTKPVNSARRAGPSDSAPASSRRR